MEVPMVIGSYLHDLEKRKTQIEQVLKSIENELQVLAERDVCAPQEKISILKSRHVEIRRELGLVEVQIEEATHPIQTRIFQLQQRLAEQIADSERENISGIIRMLRDGSWGRTEPPGENAEKWILLVGGNPIAAVNSPNDDFPPAIRAAILASSSGAIYFEPPMGFEAALLLVAALAWGRLTQEGGNVISKIGIRYKHPNENETLDVLAFLDSGASFPTLTDYDMHLIDPRSTLTPVSSTQLRTANGVVNARLYRLHMQVINVQRQELCNLALQLVAVHSNFQHLSGNFPWAHRYVASQPQGSAISVGNVKSHFLRNITAGLGTGQLTAG